MLSFDEIDAFITEHVCMSGGIRKKKPSDGYEGESFPACYRCKKCPDLYDPSAYPNDKPPVGIIYRARNLGALVNYAVDKELFGSKGIDKSKLLAIHPLSITLSVVFMVNFKPSKINVTMTPPNSPLVPHWAMQS